MVKQGYKQTDIGIIPEDWEVKTIGNLITEEYLLGHLDGNHGALYPKSEEFKNDGVPYIGANDFVDGKVSQAHCKYLSKDRAKMFKKGIAINGDVLFAHNATVGPVALLETKLDYLILSTTATYFRCNLIKLNNVFLSLLFQSEIFVNQYSPIMAQSTRSQVPITTQRKLQIPLPKLPEQIAIATVLSDIDSLITSLTDLIAKKKQIKIGTMQKLLKPQEDWEVRKVKEIGSIIRGRVISHNEIAKSNNNLYPVYSSQTSNDGVMGYIDTYDFDGEYVTWTTDGIYAGKVSNRSGKFNCTNVCGTIKLHKDDPKFVAVVLNTLTPKFVSKNLANPKLMNDVMKIIEIPLPPLQTQTKIASILINMDEEITILETKLAKYRLIKQGTMQELLTGRIRLV